ncbi:MAG TPA: rhodanese-like domain-containing protein, partial [Casimicrobiaceae bacterium]|nr:rhodanese-like domain-containing protein [Casimicrobiaceae bacterium]
MPTDESPKRADAVVAAARKRADGEGLSYFGAVTPSEAYTLLTADPAAVLIDVRTRPEWDYVGRVPGSTLIEWNTYPAGTRNPSFLEELRSVAADREAPVLFICR